MNLNKANRYLTILRASVPAFSKVFLLNIFATMIGFYLKYVNLTCISEWKKKTRGHSGQYKSWKVLSNRGCFALKYIQYQFPAFSKIFLLNIFATMMRCYLKYVNFTCIPEWKKKTRGQSDQYKSCCCPFKFRFQFHFCRFTPEWTLTRQIET